MKRSGERANTRASHFGCITSSSTRSFPLHSQGPSVIHSIHARLIPRAEFSSQQHDDGASDVATMRIRSFRARAHTLNTRKKPRQRTTRVCCARHLVFSNIATGSHRIFLVGCAARTRRFCPHTPKCANSWFLLGAHTHTHTLELPIQRVDRFNRLPIESRDRFRVVHDDGDCGRGCGHTDTHTN